MEAGLWENRPEALPQPWGQRRDSRRTKAWEHSPQRKNDSGKETKVGEVDWTGVRALQEVRKWDSMAASLIHLTAAH